MTAAPKAIPAWVTVFSTPDPVPTSSRWTRRVLVPK
ncbi:hypothetical protein HNR72_000559 [Streptomyces collinus]|uniref:Uncharacterized protein n=1 Tax=Streptomyces collinus TaxID=42684 RepID=A0AA89TDW2_STRCU|nr:hypothetical protein [Streptomyces collinus]